MKKNTYIQPLSEVVNIQFCSIVCASADPDLTLEGGGHGLGRAPRRSSPIPL